MSTQLSIVQPIAVCPKCESEDIADINGVILQCQQCLHEDLGEFFWT